MAVNPNTNFSTGAVLTAAQQNRFPRGVMAYDNRITADTTITSEEVQITGSSFTAEANRLYRVSYFEPDIYSVSNTSYYAMRIRLTNISGAVKQIGYTNFAEIGANIMPTLIWIGTLSAGTTNFVGTLFSHTGTIGASRTSDTVAYLVVEDLGPY